MLLLLLLVTASGAMAQREPLDRVIAVVDRGVVLQSELETRLKQIKSRLRAQGTRMPAEEQMRQRVLDQLILEEIQVQRARQLGMRASDSELNDAMRKVAANNGYSLEEFEQALQSEGLSFQQAREQVRREMLVSRLRQQRVGRRVRVTDREVENFMATSSAQNRSGVEYFLGHIMISVNNFNNEDEVTAARSRAQRVHDQLEQGADFRELAVAESDGRKALEGGELGWRSEQELPSLAADAVPELEVGEPSDVLRSGSGFHIVTPLDRRGAQGADNKVEQRRVRHILIDTRERSRAEAESLAKEIEQRLDGGEAFAELAREYSDDPGSAAKGGDLGWVNPGEMVPAFEQTMNTIAVGQRSDPFSSRFGWHILEVTDQRTTEGGDERRRRQARQALQQRRFELELQNWLSQIREEAYVEVKTVNGGMESAL